HNLNTTQNNTQKIIPSTNADTNIQPLHTETKTLPLNNHLKPHASQLRQKSQLPTHPLHDLNRQTNCPRQMKETIFENWNGKTIIINNTSATPPTPDSTSQNIKKIHTMTDEER